MNWKEDKQNVDNGPLDEIHYTVIHYTVIPSINPNKSLATCYSVDWNEEIVFPVTNWQYFILKIW